MFETRVPLNLPVSKELIGHFDSLMAHCDPKVGAYDLSTASDGYITVFHQTPISRERLASKVNALAARVLECGFAAEAKVYWRHRPRIPHWKTSLDQELVELGLATQVSQGCWALAGVAAQLYLIFDQDFRAIALNCGAEDVIIPGTIDVDFLHRISFFDSLPHYLSFAHRLIDDVDAIDDFVRSSKLQPGAFEPPVEKTNTLLSPAPCYQMYRLLQKTNLPPEGRTMTALGSCFRWEGLGLNGLKRLWGYSVRELVFIGTDEAVSSTRQAALRASEDYCKELGLCAEVCSANDPFFSPDGGTKGAYQRGMELKFELRLQVDAAGNSIAASSFNYMQRSFTKPCEISLVSSSSDKIQAAYSGCVGWGLERWVYAFLAQWGTNTREWPERIKGRLAKS